MQGCPEKILANPKSTGGGWSLAQFQPMTWNLNGNGETVWDWPANYAGVASSQLFSFWSSTIIGGSPSEFSQGVTKNGTLSCEYMTAIGPAYLVLGKN